MKKTHIPFLFCLLMLSFAVVKVESAEPPLALDGFFDNMYWDVRVPQEIKIGEEFSVIFRFRPITTLDIQNVNVTVSGYYGSGIEWEDSWTNMRMYWDAEYTKTAYLAATNETKVWVSIYAVYDDGFGERYVQSVEFYVAEIHPRTYQELESDYNLLNQSHLTLQSNYDSLEISFRNSQMLMFVFMITTVVFIITTVYFAIRKPKVKPA